MEHKILSNRHRINEQQLTIENFETNIVNEDGPPELTDKDEDITQHVTFDMKATTDQFEKLRLANQEVRHEGPRNLNAIMNDLNKLNEVMDELENAKNNKH
jgi:hypothetical protein